MQLFEIYGLFLFLKQKGRYFICCYCNGFATISASIVAVHVN